MTQLLTFLSKCYAGGLVKAARAAFRRGSLLSLLTQPLAWREVRLEQRSPDFPLPAPAAPPSFQLLTVWHPPSEDKNLNTSGSYHLSLYESCSNSSGNRYLEIVLAWLSEWVNCKTQTQTSSGNPEESQACSLTHVIPYSGLEDVLALTKIHHG